MAKDLDLAALADAAGKAVLGIGRHGRGSGFVISPRHVLTNAHNLRAGTTSVWPTGSDTMQGRVVAADHDRDLAVIQVEGLDVAALEWAATVPSIGAAVAAMAAPAGSLRTTEGRVAGTDGWFRTASGRRLRGALEHSAPLAPGSSGGPLLDHDGRVVGINTNRLGGGLYQAQPADERLQQLVAELLEGRAPRRPRLGITLHPTHRAAALRAATGLPPRDGALISGVLEDGPAARAGLTRGDLLVTAGGAPVRGPDDLTDVLDQVGAALELVVVRGVEERQVTVDLTDPEPQAA